MKGGRHRLFTTGLFMAALVIAACVSQFASGRPDGLEHVAGSLGFAGAADPHAAAGGVFADYGVRGWDSTVGSAIAGVVGCVATLALTLFLTFRRPSDRTTS